MIGQPLASKATQRDISALLIVDAKLGASVLPEIELGKIPVEMLAIDVLIDADKAPLEDRKEEKKPSRVLV